MNLLWLKISGYRWRVLWDRPPFRCAMALTLVLLLLGGTNALGSGYSSLGHRAWLAYNEGNRTSWNLHQSFFETEYSTERAGLSWIAGIRHSQPSGDFRWGFYGNEQYAPVNPEDTDGGRLSGRIYFFEPDTRALILAGLPQKTAFIRGEIGFRGNNKTEYAAAVGMRPNKFFGVELGQGRFYPFPSYSELYYTPFNDGGPIGSEGGHLEWNLPASRKYFRLSAFYSGRLKASYRQSHISLQTDQPKYGDYPMGTYTGELYGGWIVREASVAFTPLAGWDNELKYSELMLQCDSLTAHDGGLKFAYFGILEGNGHMWSYSAAYKRYVMKINLGRAEGRAMGTVQAWPFLSGLYHFLGERRHFIAQGNIQWYHASLDSRIWEESWLKVHGGVEFLRVQPDLAYVTWRPYFIGMGVDDLRAGSLDLQRADLARVKFSPRVKWSYLVFTADISQWIPIDTRKASDGVPGGDSGDGSDAGDGDKRNIWGGFSATLSITASF